MSDPSAGGDLGTSLVQALRNAPDLTASPSLAYGAATSTDPPGTAQAVSQAANTQALDTATTKIIKTHGGGFLHHALSFLGGVTHPALKAVETAGSFAMNALAKPLQEVQHQYRYLHDVEARHGPIQALMEGLGIAGGAAVGGLVAGEHGAVLGGEAVAGTEGRLIHTDSWRATASAKYVDPHTGRPVSIGRDFASAVGLRPNTAPFTVVSGATDFLSDMELDPLAQAGGFVAATRTAEGAPGLLGRAIGGTGITTPEDVERLAASARPGVRKTISDLARMSAGDIVADSRFGKIAALAPKLGAASSTDEVWDVFRNALSTNEMLTSTLPTTSFTRIPFAKLRQMAVSAGGTEEGGLNALGRVVRPFTLLPTAWDPELARFSSSEFNPADNFGLQGLYRTMRMGLSDDAARQVVDAYAVADPAGRIRIYQNSLLKMLQARGLDDSEMARGLKAEIMDHTGGAGAGREAQYGLDEVGHNLSHVIDPETGNQIAAGITDNQAGKLAFPDFGAITREVRALHNGTSLYGRLDDFAYEHFTRGVFKRLVLLSGGFAERIAAAEAIPGGLRVGFTNMLKARIAGSAARLGVDAGDEELSHVGAALSYIYGGAAKVLRLSPERQQFDTDLTLLDGSHTVAPGLDANHHITAEFHGGATEKATNDLYKGLLKVPPREVGTDRFTLFHASDPRFNDRWQRWLSEVSGDAKSQAAAAAYSQAKSRGASEADAFKAGADAATEWLQRKVGQDANYAANMVRARVSSTEGVDPLVDWGRVTMANVKGVTTGADGTLHDALMGDVANGRITSRGALDNIDAANRPGLVKGREAAPYIEGTLERIANVGFAKVLNPVVNFVSREPLYREAAWREFTALKPAVEQGLLGYDEALQLARERAVVGVIPFIHNIAERSQFSELARNYMPFWFAQTQSYRRYGRLLADDPGAFRRFQLMASMLSNVGSQKKDANGKDYLMYPGSGFLTGTSAKALGALGVFGDVVDSAPVSFSGQLRSLKTVFPFQEGVQPSFGPIVGIGAHALMSMFPEASPTISHIIGPQAAAGGIWDQLIPNQTIKNLVKTFAPGAESQRSYQNAMMSTIQALAYRQDVAMDAWTKAGHAPTDPGHPDIVPGPDAGPVAQQAFIDRVRNQTRILFLLKTVVGAVAPAAPVINIGDLGLKAELRALVDKEGLSQGVTDFLAKNPDATPYTTFMSRTAAGQDIPATLPAEQWINDHADLINRYPYAAAWLIPQTKGDPFNQTVYNEQLAQHLRLRKAPDQFLKDVYVAAGNAQYYGTDYPTYRNALAAAAGNPDAVSQLRASWNAYLTTFGQQNPIWWDDFKSVDRQTNRQQAVLELQTMAKNGDLVGPQADGISSLLSDYEIYQQSLLPGRTDAAAGQSRTQVKDSWRAYMDDQAKAHPELAGVINRVFRDL